MEPATVRIHYAVLCRTAHTQGSDGLFTLFQVRHRFSYGGEKEFPIRAGTQDLFLRFYVDKPGAETFLIRMWWLGDDGITKIKVAEFGPKRVEFTTQSPVQDLSFKLHDLTFPRAGDYALRVCRPSRKRWKKVRWKVLNTEYLHVEHFR